METLEPYYRRFRKRFFRDATPWARDNIIWGSIVLVVPAFAAYLRDRHALMDWILIKNSRLLYGFAFAIYISAYMRGTARRLDDDRDMRERALVGAISEHQRTVEEHEETIRVLSEKPKRRPAEQHDYETVKKALELVKDKGKNALRFLRSQGTLTFAAPGSGINPVPPSGLTRV